MRPTREKPRSAEAELLAAFNFAKSRNFKFGLKLEVQFSPIQEMSFDSRQNEIEEARRDIARYFDPSAAVPESDREFNSPSGLYLAKTVQFKQTDPDRNRY